MENVDFAKLETLFNDVMKFLKSFIEEISIALAGIKKVWGWSEDE